MNPNCRLGYFYFDFNDGEKQRHENFIRSLLTQLSMQSERTLHALQTLYSRSQDGTQQPSYGALVSTLRSALQDSLTTFIILDAADECTDRGELLELLLEISKWNTGKVQIVCTSRKERDIEESLIPEAWESVCIQSDQVSSDIHLHICERLQNDSKFKKWPLGVRREIETALVTGAQGM